jgi:hypothetical protein
MTDTSESNVAEILRNIAAESDAVSGKIIRKATKAANKGKSSILVGVDKEDWECISYRQSQKLTAPMERLVSLGFKLESKRLDENFSIFCYGKIRVSW